MRQRLFVGAAIGVTSLLVASCAANVDNNDEPAFETKIDQSIDEAKAEGASDAQLALLDQIRESGKVDIEVQRTAMRSTVQCFIASGLEAKYEEAPNSNGLLLPGYDVGYDVAKDPNLDSEDYLALIDECDRSESWWVSRLYQTQPTSVEQKEAYLDALIPQMRQCLVDAGYSVADDATGTDLQVQIARAEADTGQDLGCIAPESAAATP